MDHARQGAQRVDHPGPRPMHHVAIDGIHAALAHSADRAEPLPAAEHLVDTALSVTSDDDPIGAALDDGFEREPRIGERLGPGDALAARALDELADERAASGRDQ